jgi:phosphoglycerate dehydrogenase-like enzyme
MKVLTQVREALAAQVAAAVPEVELVPVARDGEPPPGVEGEVLLTYPWASPNLDRILPRGVRWVHVIGTGVDAFPLELLGDQVLTCSRGASAVPIAEWVLAMMLAFEKRLPDTWITSLPPAGWNRAALGTLDGKVLGLVGFGAIGSAVARRALPFGMRLRALRRSRSKPEVEGVELVESITDLASSSDHLVVAAASTPATRGLVGREAFAAVKPGAHLVNIARGGIIDQDALRAALDDGRIARASLDAVEPEPLPEGHWLFAHPRVRLSPHVSWSMPGAADLLVQAFIENLRRYRAGEPLNGIVDREAGY